LKDVAILNSKQIKKFYVIVSQCKSGVDTYEGEIAADSIIWELFAKKSAECFYLCNSFITISSLLQKSPKVPNYYVDSAHKEKMLSQGSNLAPFEI